MEQQNTEALSRLANNFAKQEWRLENLYKISDKVTRQTVVFTPNPVQVELISKGGDRDLILKARQQGVSTFYELMGLDEVLWNNNYWCAIIAHRRETLDILFTKIQFAWDNLDSDLKQIIGEPKSDNKYELYWRERNSRIYVSLEVLGGTNQRVHFSEYALIDDNRISNTLPTVPPGGKIIKESTPFGTNNKFYHEYGAAKAGESNEQAFFFEWWWSPEYKADAKGIAYESLTPIEKSLVDNKGLDLKQIAWRRQTWKDQRQPDGSNLFPQVYPEDDISCFMASGDSVFDAESVQTRLAHVKRNKKVFVVGNILYKNGGTRFVEDLQGPLKVYEAPKRGFEYCIGDDISLGGQKSDNQASVVLKRGEREVVAVYVNKTEIGIFADDAANLGRFYNLAWHCPERNSIGEAFIEHLLQIYPNERIYRQQNRLQQGSRTRVTRFGYNTTRGRNIGKRRLVTLIQDWLRDEGWVWDEDVLEELLSYQRLDLISPEEGYKMGAIKGNKDDRVMALGLALEMDASLPVFRAAIQLVQDAWENEFQKTRRRQRQLEPHWAAY